jgi:amino acid adenylation domain-containing protein
VGICVERSLEMVVGLLGILKAGGAYVPLDPHYPQERLSYMLEDAQVSVILTQQHLLEKLQQHQTQLVYLDTDWRLISQLNQDHPLTAIQTTNLAYVIYTSGSTGQPKGVMVAHQGLLNLVFWHQQTFKITSLDKATQLAGTGFDAAVWELWPYLTAGASIYLVKPELLTSPINLRDWLISQKITMSFVPTPVAQELLSLEWATESIALRYILTGGDKLHQYPSVSIPFQVVNNYGPTENTVVTTSGLVVAQEQNQISPTIGQPIANTQVYILDQQLQPVPVGVPGELHIGGAGLARGYLNRPELTQEKFIPNPFKETQGSRLYKTGDLARYLPDGNIEYLGRIDNQVKIRGFRIELGEVEAVLTQHPVVRETVVIARENSAGDKQLVAYLVPHQEPAPTNSDLRHFLKAQLPDYMMPSAFVVLEALPLTPNGKVDRRALPQPELRPELEPTFVAPRTPIEEILANIWGCVLGIEQVGIDDNFFELGGHSLLATQVISRVRNTLAVELPLRSLFETPTVASFAQQVENSLHSGQSISDQPLLPISRSSNLPLSFAQARLWFLDQLQPNSAFYNIPTALRLSGQLNVTALESNINEIIRRHEALRTNFTTIEGQPIQVIASTLELKLLFVDLQNLPFDEREVEAQRLATNEAQQPFDLEREPLVRVMVLQLGSSEYVFLLIVHHIIFDGWSTDVFYGELAALYEAKCTGKPLILPELPVQYADFAVWQRHWLTGEVLETQLNYWKQQLKDAPTLLELPTDRLRPAVQTFRGTHQYIALSLELSEALAELSKGTGVTLFMTLYAAFVTLLYRYTGSDDIVIGTPVANRTPQEIEGLIGFFVNTLALRTDLSGNPIFEQLLRRVREVALQAYTHQDLPFEQLVEALQPERSLSHTPLFQVMFALDDALVPSMDLLDLTVSSYSVESGTTKFDLTLSMENTASGLIGEWEYNSDLFDATTIERMAEHLQTLLEGIVANPEQRISELPLLTQTERQQLLFEWNNTTTEYPQDKCIHQLFEEQVERSPDAVAVVFEEEQLTYRELNTRANQLAHYLRSLGVGPEVLVGICVERSFNMIIGLLGVLKADGAYVPIDPAYPTERIAYILSDSRLPILLTQQKLVAFLPEHQARIVYLDSDWEEIATKHELPPISDVTPENLAYVIYTSGSTGQPKGVMVAHQGLLNLVFWHQQTFKITSLDKATQLAGTGFDAAVWELWPYLTAGASIYLVKPELLTSPINLRDWLISQKITMSFVPTPVAQELLSLEWATESIALRYILTGGDKLHQYPSVSIPFQVVNNYGPTENTVVTTSGLVVAQEQNQISPTIGQPIANTQVYILDQQLQPVPVGVPGELHIGGAGLARGYLNRPELTQEKFIPNPFKETQGSRLYKTGDLARYLPDGNIEYLGRIDNQVKIRGFRIELGEVEAVLTQHPVVRETVVIARENSAGDKQLVAYLVPHQEPAPTNSDLRHFLKAQLPDYMMPSAFVVLEALPLTPNGKVDRRALPQPELRPELEPTFVAPQTPTEELVASIWEKVLRVSQVGINDNFFELGGHSLLATQLLLQVNDACRVELPLSKLFEAPTVASLSNYIEAISWVNQSLDTSNNIVSTREEVEF